MARRHSWAWKEARGRLVNHPGQVLRQRPPHPGLGHAGRPGVSGSPSSYQVPEPDGLGFQVEISSSSPPCKAPSPHTPASLDSSRAAGRGHRGKGPVAPTCTPRGGASEKEEPPPPRLRSCSPAGRVSPPAKAGGGEGGAVQDGCGEAREARPRPARRGGPRGPGPWTRPREGCGRPRPGAPAHRTCGARAAAAPDRRVPPPKSFKVKLRAPPAHAHRGPSFRIPPPPPPDRAPPRDLRPEPDPAPAHPGPPRGGRGRRSRGPGARGRLFLGPF